MVVRVCKRNKLRVKVCRRRGKNKYKYLPECELVVVESLKRGMRGGGATAAVQRLTVRPTPCLGPPVREETEDAGSENTELEEDDCSTWGKQAGDEVTIVISN